jgi:hypothetical protein
MYLGGNIGAIGAHGNDGFYERLAMLQPGDVARLSVLFHEIFWFKDPASWEFKEVVEMLTACKKAKVIPVIQVTCAFHPFSEWYQGSNWNQWWLIREDLWPNAYVCAEELLKVIQKTAADLKMEFFYQIHNEPSKGKPGGTDLTPHAGAWNEAHHRFWFGLCPIVAKYVKKEHIVGPARSCFLEGGGGYNCLAEMATCIPPKTADWRVFCGIPHVRHIRLSASWAAGNLALFEAGIRDELDLLFSSQHLTEWFAITELYVSIGDTGKQLGADTTQEKMIALKVISEIKNLKFVCLWGMKDVESDPGLEGSTWFQYGGWGKALAQYRGKPLPLPPLPPIVVDPPVVVNPPVTDPTKPPITTKPISGSVPLTGFPVSFAKTLHGD